MGARAIVLFAHGARDPQWAEPFENVRARVERRLPNTSIELAFLEFMQPDLATAVEKLIAGGASEIDIVPLFMAQGGHLKQDVPRIVDDLRARFATAKISLSPPIGEVEPILQAIADWVVGDSR
jgi:sirohydrochlorin cobaltochelatase